MIAMTLMPDASYREAPARLAGLLADIPFIREWHVPTGKVVTDWRLPVPPGRHGRQASTSSRIAAVVWSGPRPSSRRRRRQVARSVTAVS